MRYLTRRNFTRQCFAAIGGLSTAALLGQSRCILGNEPQRQLLGKLVTRPATAIAASPLGVGFETLDRRMFDPDRTYEHLVRLGVKWARVQTGWARTETVRGKYDFAWLDAIIDDLRKTGVEPWFNVTYGNRLYTPDAADESAVGWAPIHRDEAREGWRRFVRALAEHFRGRVRHWEIWNEPTEGWFWKPGKPSPAGYVDLVKLTAPEIRAAIPDSVLIGGALSGMPTEYLRGCLEAGIATHVDKISYHPYQLIPEKDYQKRVSAWREMIARYNPSLALWQGECGCPSEEGGVGALSKHRWNEMRQARWLLRRTLNDLRLGLEQISYFHLVDQLKYSWASGPEKDLAAKEQKNLKASFGLLRGEDYTPKPSYYAYQVLCNLFDADTLRADLTMQFNVEPSGNKPVEAEKICSGCFVRRGYPLQAYWWPSDVQEDFAAQSIGLVLPGKDAPLSRPVLIDPLRNEVFRLAGSQTAGVWAFPSVPLTDYPMIITDLAAIDCTSNG